MLRFWLTKFALALLVSSPTLLLSQFKRVDSAQPPASISTQPPYSLDQPAISPPSDPNLPPDSPDNVNPSDAQHAVARLSFLHGEVNVQRGSESAGTVAAAVNAPLMASDRLQTGGGASAEIEVDRDTVLRVAENSDLGFGALDGNGFQAQLGAGTVIYRVLRPGQLGGELDTPNVAIHPAGAADLRVSILPDGTTLVQVRAGDAELIGPNGSEHLLPGRAYMIRGNAADPEFQEVALAAHDGFDSWSASRDAAALRSQSAQYLPPGVSGAADLDANGTWVPSEYGEAWAPSGMPATWSPYSDGSWTYQSYYGWTWVDRSSWGWAPFHYGRWFRNANYGWCWWPGARTVARPWRPALVGFYGWGGGYRGLGWVPLAPYERVRPWWGNSPRPLGFGGGSHAPSYRNSAFRGAVTFASYRGFAGPNTRFSHVSREQLALSAPLGGRIPVTPAPSSYSFARRDAFNVRTNSFGSRSFVSAERYRGSRSSFTGSTYNPVPGWKGVGAAARPAAPAPRVSRAPNTSWGHFGDPGSNSFRRQSPDRQTFRPNPNRGGGESGWHDFGRPSSPRGGNRGDGAGGRGRR